MAHPAAPRLSVVVPVYNDAGNLEAALGRLADQTLPHEAYEVVVVDDGSTDATPGVIAAAAARAPVAVVRFEANRGRAAARNAGIRAARAPVIVFIDSDVLVGRDFLARHLQMHGAAARPVVGRGPVVAIATPVVPARPPMTRISSAYLDTANASVPRQALIDAGLFDEGFRAYGWEDFDLGLRLRARRIRRVFSPAALAFHVVPPPAPDSFGRYLRKEEERARTALYLLRKHPGLSTRLLIQDTAAQRLVHFLAGGAGLITERNAPAIERWLRARGLHTLAFLTMRGVLNRHYLRTMDRIRALGAGDDLARISP
jgi:glycosyltransferase involved in cell wall biosynthesis